MSASGQKLTANRLIQHVRLLANFGRDATLGFSPVGAMNAGKLFLVVADTTNLVTDLRVESLLLEGLVRARSWPPVGGLFYRSLGGILHNRFTERSTVLALNVSQLFASVHVRLRRDDAVRGVGAPHIKVSILEAALAIVEHIKRLRLVI
jgi:hypothetical protein